MRQLRSYLVLGVLLMALSLSLSAGQRGATTAPTGPPQPNPTAPLYQFKGEQYRIYNYPVTGESIPYRLFVPSRWTPTTKLPLLVTLRAGNTVDGPYRAGNDLVKEAEKRGYIVVTPMGYRGYTQPYYGSPYPIVRPTGPSVPAAGWTPEENARSEQDVMYVIDLVSKEYNVDTSRIYLHGQNPSGSGAFHIAAKNPDMFAALIISSSPIVTDNYPFANIKGKMGLMIIHGDQDTNNPIAASQKLAETAKAAGVETVYATVPGGTHLEAYLTYAPQIFDFLDKHKK